MVKLKSLICATFSLCYNSGGNPERVLDLTGELISTLLFGMNIHVIEVEGVSFAEIINEKYEIKSAQDGLDIVGNSICMGSYKIIIREEGFAPEFFDLKTGLAGEILQKFSNYNCELAIIGDFSKYPSKALQDFIWESNKNGQINFVGSMEEAQRVLMKNG